jgi:uncharacterized coiled-coil DUF342 family protein
MSNREEYIRKMQEKLEEWNAEIDTLTAKAGKIGTDVKNEYHEQIETLKVKLTGARGKIEEFKHSGDGAWEDMKSGIELAWTALGEAVDSAKLRFK